jgi:hypothetical protein
MRDFGQTTKGACLSAHRRPNERWIEKSAERGGSEAISGAEQKLAPGLNEWI